MPFGSLLSRRLARGSASAYLGLICSPGRSAAAVVRSQGWERPSLVAQTSFDDDPNLAQLGRWLREERFSGLPASLLLPREDYQILPIEAPPVPAAELAQATRWRIKDMLDFPVDDACVDCLKVPAPDGQGFSAQAWAVVAKRSVLQQWLQRARQARINVQAIDIPELALRNWLALEPLPHACALLRVGVHHTALVVAWHGELCTFRRFDMRADEFIDADLHTRQQLFERLGLEVQRTADAFERQFHGTVIDRIWVEESIPEVDLVRQLAPQVALRVQPFRVHDLLDDAAPTRAGAQAHHLVALGGALRQTLALREAV